MKMKRDNVKPIRPRTEDWNNLSTQKKNQEAAVDIIIPVYGAPDDTLRCIYSVLKTKNQTLFNLVVIEDAGPVPELRTILRDLSEKFSFEYYENKENKGFVLTCNFGFQIHPQRDLILLNSDTEVFDGWVDTIVNCAIQNPKAGTITAMSNNATICSYPLFCEDFSYCYEIPDSELNKLFFSENKFNTVKAPTGVGFCMYVRRKCLNQIGYFNYELFGKGYGEENDLCIRAEKAGWDNLIAMGLFVRHYGSSSFSNTQRLERVENALKIINNEHPKYLKDVERFIKEDPIFEYRNRIDIKRLKNYVDNKNKKLILNVTHSLGGGTEKHVLEITEKLISEGFSVLSLQPDIKNNVLLSIENKYPLPNLKFKLESVEEIYDFLNDMELDFIHIHHLKGFSNNFVDNFLEAAIKSNIPYYFTLHDYYAICPRINLIDDTGLFCGEPDNEQCNICIRSCNDSMGHSIERWRGWYQKILENAYKIFVPDLDVKWRFMRYFDNMDFVVRPHFDSWQYDESTFNNIQNTHSNSKIKRIGIIGAIGLHKGFYILKEVSEICSRYGFNLEFIVIGYTQDDISLKNQKNVKILGKYQDDKLIEIINKEHLDAIWFPAICPETYSYTLSACLITGLPIIAFDFGAIGRRLASIENYIPVPLKYMLNPGSIIQYLLKEKEILKGETVEYVYSSLKEDYYQI